MQGAYNPTALVRQAMFFQKNDPNGSAPNHSLRFLDLSWRLDKDPGQGDTGLREAHPLCPCALSARPSEALTNGPTPLPTNLWLGELPAAGKARPPLAGNVGARHLYPRADARAVLSSNNSRVPVPMIETRDLTKMYGELYALDRLTLKLEKGDVYGFIGPNGAGKTTTMRILATLLNPTWGEATVCGYSIYNGAKDIRRVMGYMPDFFGVYDDMKVIEYLEFFAAAYRIKGPERRRKCDQVLDLVDLGYKRDALVTSLSRGMTQRLGLARVLLHEPQVLLLDEPASGLDPRARIEMRGLIKELRNLGKTILVSSHILPELADICNKIGIIERGKLLFDGDVASAIKQVRQRHVLTVIVGEGRNPEAKDADRATCQRRGHRAQGAGRFSARHAARRHQRRQLHPGNPGPQRLPPQDAQGEGDRPRRRVHGDHQGHHELGARASGEWRGGRLAATSAERGLDQAAAD